MLALTLHDTVEQKPLHPQKYTRLRASLGSFLDCISLNIYLWASSDEDPLNVSYSTPYLDYSSLSQGGLSLPDEQNLVSD